MNAGQQLVGVPARAGDHERLVDVAIGGRLPIGAPAVGDDRRAGLDALGEEGPRGSPSRRRGGRPSGSARARYRGSRRRCRRASLPSAPRPRRPGSGPPNTVSSTSTRPDSRSGLVRPIAVRKRWSIAHAVCSEPETEDPPEAERRGAVLLARHICQAARNHVVSGVRVPWKIVPAVAEVSRAPPAHDQRPSAVRQPSGVPHAGQTKPSGQRSHSRSSRQAASSGHQLTSSARVRG